MGAGAALWLSSIRLARRNQARHPDQYKVVRYEDLVTLPVEVLEDVCQFLGEDFADSMLRISSAP